MSLVRWPAAWLVGPVAVAALVVVRFAVAARIGLLPFNTSFAASHVTARELRTRHLSGEGGRAATARRRMTSASMPLAKHGPDGHTGCVHDLLASAAPRLDDFLTWWYGPADRREPGAPSTGDRVPRPLREWFEVTSRWSQPVAAFNSVHDAESGWVENGKLVFWVENQGVWLWGMDPTEDDPQVYDRENEPDRPWEATGVPLSVFLVHIAVFEAIWNARLGASAAWITPQQLDEVLTPLAPIPGAAWRWPCPTHRLYVGDGLLAMAGPNYGAGETAETAEYREVFVAGRQPASLGYLANINGVDWDWASR